MLKCKVCLIIQISLSRNTFYIFWTKSMLIQITQQLLSIDLVGPHIQFAMGNVSLPIHLRKFCNETKLIIMSNTFIVALNKINPNCAIT